MRPTHRVDAAKQLGIDVDEDITIKTMHAWLAGEPVWPRQKIIDEWGDHFEHWQKVMFKKMDTALLHRGMHFPAYEDAVKEHLDGYVKRFAVRDRYIQLFGFAIPCAELLDELASPRHVRVIEVGAGTGYMTRLMKHRNISVISSDWEWAGQNDYGFLTAQYDPDMVTGTPAKMMVRRFHDATIFCSWPTLNHTWFRQALKAMKVGQQLVVIREAATAEDTAWNYLETAFEQTGDVDIPTFEHMNDHAEVHIKKRRG